MFINLKLCMMNKPIAFLSNRFIIFRQFNLYWVGSGAYATLFFVNSDNFCCDDFPENIFLG